MEYVVRKALESDLIEILEIYELAREFMARSGNPCQWGKTTPQEGVLRLDVEKGNLYVLENDTGIHGVFALILEEDPTYGRIYDGTWRRNQPYGVIHRVASDGSGDIFRSVISYAESRTSYLRIDTHADNHIMQRQILKAGFTYCGFILLANGSPRLAYDRI